MLFTLFMVEKNYITVTKSRGADVSEVKGRCSLHVMTFCKNHYHPDFKPPSFNYPDNKLLL